MKAEEIASDVKLLMDLTDSNPYKGKLSEEDNLFHALELVDLLIRFAKDGQSDEAMHKSHEHWQKVKQALNETKPQ